MVGSVSCLCVTEQRDEWLARSYKMYAAQTYTEKEWVVVYPVSDKKTAHLLYELQERDSSVKAIAIKDAHLKTLGEKRNVAISSSSGSYVCNWDDDDLYHQERIARSIDCIQQYQTKAMALVSLLLFDVRNSEAYLSTRRLWEGSVVCEKKYLLDNGIYYSNKNKGEDVSFLAHLSDVLYPLCDPSLYVYVCHNKNTCNSLHFDEHMALSQKLNNSLSKTIASALDETTDITTALTQMNNQFLSGEYSLWSHNHAKWWGVNPFCHYPKSF